MLPRNNSLKNIARVLRKNMTRQEKHLWYDYLSKYPVKFNRQKIIGSYIADFYCDKAKLVIELDGSQHYNQNEAEKDKKRTEYFNSLGLKVIRFSNNDCDANFDGICTSIDRKIKERY